MLNVITQSADDMTDEELDAQLAMIIRAHADRGTTAVRKMIDEQFPEVPETRLRASTHRLAERGFAVSDGEWRRHRS